VLPAEKTTTTPARAASAIACGSDDPPGSSGASSGPSDRLSTRAPRATAQRTPAATSSGRPTHV
jgi:hypothetical protein